MDQNAVKESVFNLGKLPPYLYIVAQMLLLCCRDKVARLSLVRRRGKRLLLMQFDEHRAVPPPRHLFPQMAFVLRWLGRQFAKDATSTMEVVYTETKTEKRCEVFLSHPEGQDSFRKVEALLLWLAELQEARRQLKVQLEQRQRRRRVRHAAVTIGLSILLLSGFILLLVLQMR